MARTAVSQLQTKANATTSPDDQDNASGVEVTIGASVLSGKWFRFTVERGHPIVQDGICRERREGRLTQIMPKLHRVVVLGHSGTISFEALRWLSDLGAAFVQIDADGEVIAATAPLGLDDPRLRRPHALAATNGVGTGMARDLLAQKLRGQADVIARIPGWGSAQANVNEALTALGRANSVEQLRSLEAQVAIAYRQAWSALEVLWARKDVDWVPQHWRTFGARTSPLTASPRNAGNPANAIVNYLYAILEAEARIAILSIGLDPGMGVLHADLKARDSLALDLMEAVRPRVDAFVLGLLHTNTFATRNFFETRLGVCRLLPPMTHWLADMTPTWSKAIAPIAQGIAHILLQGSSGLSGKDKSEPTLLADANRSAVRGVTKRTQSKSRALVEIALPQACRICGTVLEDRSRSYCDACFPERRAEIVASFASLGPAALAKRRAEGTDPAHTFEARRKQGLRAEENVRANAEWESKNRAGEHDVDFTRDILPRLQESPLSHIMQVSGLSLRYCSLIRRGLKVPRRRHWEALSALGVVCASDER